MSTQTDPSSIEPSKVVSPSDASVSNSMAASHEEEHDAEGNSIAAWTAVVIMLVGFAVGTIAFMFDYPIVVWIAFVVVILGLVTGQVLKRMGYGVGGHRYVPKAHN